MHKCVHVALAHRRLADITGFEGLRLVRIRGRIQMSVLPLRDISAHNVAAAMYAILTITQAPTVTAAIAIIITIAVTKVMSASLQT